MAEFDLPKRVPYWYAICRNIGKSSVNRNGRLSVSSNSPRQPILFMAFPQVDVLEETDVSVPVSLTPQSVEDVTPTNGCS